MKSDSAFQSPSRHDPAAVQRRSLDATLAKVRTVRRARRTIRSAAVLCLVAATVRLVFPEPDPGPVGPSVARGDPLRIRTVPLQEDQRISPVAGRGLFIRSGTAPRMEVVHTDPASVQRVDDAAFAALLSRYAMSCIQFAGEDPRIVSMAVP